MFWKISRNTKWSFWLVFVKNLNTLCTIRWFPESACYLNFTFVTSNFPMFFITQTVDIILIPSVNDLAPSLSVCLSLSLKIFHKKDVQWMKVVPGIFVSRGSPPPPSTHLMNCLPSLYSLISTVHVSFWSPVVIKAPSVVFTPDKPLKVILHLLPLWPLNPRWIRSSY